MIKDKSIALVIQGPIVSSGNSGAGENIQSYDCTQNIKKYIESLYPLIDFFIISTWNSNTDQSTLSFTNQPYIKLLQLEDPGPRKTLTNTMLTNDYRQAYGIFIGIQFAFENFKPDYIIKVRTDQFCDVEEMCYHMISVDATYHDYGLIGQQGFIFLPNTLRWSPYSVGDFYIGGHAEDMFHFFEAQCKLHNHSFSNIFSWIHSDLIFRHAYANLFDKLDIEKFNFFPNIAPSYRFDRVIKPKNLKYHPDVLILWQELLKKSICTYPKSIALNLLWRGSRMSEHQHTLGDFYDEWVKMRDDVKFWFASNMPDQYLPNYGLTRIQKFISFSSEKEKELRCGKLINGRMVLMTRFLLSILLGQFPINEWALNKWGKIQKKLNILVKFFKVELIKHN